MKQLVLVLVFILSSVCGYSQVVRNGNTFSKVNNSTRDTVVTKYTYKDRDGKTYRIILNRSNGHCYIYRCSKKSGHYYRMYFTGKNDNISKIICHEMNVGYKPTK